MIRNNNKFKNTHQYLEFISCHPFKTKLHVTFNLTRIFCTIITDKFRVKMMELEFPENKHSCLSCTKYPKSFTNYMHWLKKICAGKLFMIILNKWRKF